MCKCRSNKGTPNRTNELWLVKEIYAKYNQLINETSIQYMSKEQRELILEWYYELYPKSVVVDYKTANKQLLKVFELHKL